MLYTNSSSSDFDSVKEQLRVGMSDSKNLSILCCIIATEWTIPKKTSNRGIFCHAFLTKPLKYLGYFTLGYSGQNKATPLKIPQDCVTHF